MTNGQPLWRRCDRAAGSPPKPDQPTRVDLGSPTIEARTDDLALRPLRIIGEAAGELLAEAALPSPKP